MSRIVALLFDPAFWFATIVAGIVVGIFGNFATEALKKVWGRFSSRQRARSAEERQWIETEATKCTQSTSYMVYWTYAVNNWRIMMLLYNLGAYFGLLGLCLAVSALNILGDPNGIEQFRLLLNSDVELIVSRIMAPRALTFQPRLDGATLVATALAVLWLYLIYLLGENYKVVRRAETGSRILRAARKKIGEALEHRTAGTD